MNRAGRVSCSSHGGTGGRRDARRYPSTVLHRFFRRSRKAGALPIDADERETGTATGEPRDEDNDPRGTGKRLIVAFLGEDVGQAYTKTVILAGVEFAADDGPGSRPGVLGGIGDAVLDAVSQAAAAGIGLGDLDRSLEELVAAGVVKRREIDTPDGTTTYYRMADDAR